MRDIGSVEHTEKTHGFKALKSLVKKYPKSALKFLLFYVGYMLTTGLLLGVPLNILFLTYRIPYSVSYAQSIVMAIIYWHVFFAIGSEDGVMFRLTHEDMKFEMNAIFPMFTYINTNAS